VSPRRLESLDDLVGRIDQLQKGLNVRSTEERVCFRMGWLGVRDDFRTWVGLGLEAREKK
jgi:hypothetical protein